MQTRTSVIALTVRLRSDVFQKLRDKAEKEQRSMSWIVSKLVEECVKQEQKENFGA